MKTLFDSDELCDEHKPQKDAMKSTVGKGSRTPLKHWLLKQELGRLVGIFSNKNTASKIHAIACPLHVIDLCAGDGSHKDAGNTSSPFIISEQLKTAASNGVDVKGTFIERDEFAFQKLSSTKWPSFIETMNSDAKLFRIQQKHKHQQFFINSDPNCIADHPITSGLLHGLPETTFFISTLGCNVGGLKRLPTEKREGWFDHVNDIVRHMPRYHDCIIVSLQNDSSQWAYLLAIPKAWSCQTCVRIEKSGRKKFNGWDLRVDSKSINPSSFADIQKQLFLTRKEYANEQI